MKLNRLFAIAMICFTTVLTGSCGNLDTRPKTLGGSVNVSPDDSSNSENFRFIYAYRDSDAATSPNTRAIHLKGAENSLSAIISTCNSAGTGCYCDFYDGTGTLLETASGTGAIAYSSANNTVRCLVSGATNPANISTVVVRNSDSSIASAEVSLVTSLSLAQILNGLSVDKLRIIHRYKCKRNFLQKTGTTYTSFDCTNGGGACAAKNITFVSNAANAVITVINHGYTVGQTITVAGVTGAVSANGSFAIASVVDANTFTIAADTSLDPAYTGGGTTTRTNPACSLSLVHTDFNYFLFAGNEANNYTDKVVDILYGNGGSQTLCNMQVKQYDCVNTVTANGGIPSKIFGVYGLQADAYTAPLTLNVAPKKGSTIEGYVAALEEFPAGSGNFVCPAGLKRYDSFTTNVDGSDFASSNMPDKDVVGDQALDSLDTDVWPVTTATPAPTAINVQTTSGGSCNGTTCTEPSGAAVATGVTYSYTAAGSRFCAIPSLKDDGTALLP
jgi:hypothetical protein